MKRDMDLIRELMFKLEELPLRPGAIATLKPSTPEIQVEGYSHEQIQYHLDLIKKAGFIETPGTGPLIGMHFKSISWSGHDFIDSVRSKEIWEKTKQGAEAAGGFTVDLLKALAKGFVKKQIEDRTGVQLDL